MDFYGIGATSMAMSDIYMKQEASLSIMKKSMDLPERSVDFLLDGLAEMTGLGQYVDMQV